VPATRHQAPGSGASQAREFSDSADGLLVEMDRLVAVLEGRFLGESTRPTLDEKAPPTKLPTEPAAPELTDSSAPCGFQAATNQRLTLLRHLLASGGSAFEPRLNPYAPLGHSCDIVDQHFDCEPGASLGELEDLADLGLLQRETFNRVHTCPNCEHCQINFREQCPSCASISLDRERIVHHFRCGYTGLESEFARDYDLVCPKCRKELFQLGQDFDRPHETYVCGDCQYLFEEPNLQGQCLNCATEFQSADVVETRVYRYRPTPLTIRAVELGRLTGLEVDSILYDADLQVATPDFLDFVVKRELIRLGRYTTAFSTCTLSLMRFDLVFPVFREWPASRMRELCVLLSKSLRSLDLVTRLDSSRIGILMPESGIEGPSVARDRLLRLLEGFQLTDNAGHALTPAFESITWSKPGTTFDDVKAFLNPEQSVH